MKYILVISFIVIVAVSFSTVKALNSSDLKSFQINDPKDFRKNIVSYVSARIDVATSSIWESHSQIIIRTNGNIEVNFTKNSHITLVLDEILSATNAIYQYYYNDQSRYVHIALLEHGLYATTNIFLTKDNAKQLFPKHQVSAHIEQRFSFLKELQSLHTAYTYSCVKAEPWSDGISARQVYFSDHSLIIVHDDVRSESWFYDYPLTAEKAVFYNSEGKFIQIELKDRYLFSSAVYDTPQEVEIAQTVQVAERSDLKLEYLQGLDFLMSLSGGVLFNNTSQPWNEEGLISFEISNENLLMKIGENADYTYIKKYPNGYLFRKNNPLQYLKINFEVSDDKIVLLSIVEDYLQEEPIAHHVEAHNIIGRFDLKPAPNW